MSHYSMFLPTKVNVKLADGKTGHAQGIGIFLCCFPNWSIIYPVGKVYYFPCHPSNTISSGDIKFYVEFQKFTSEPLEQCDLVDPQFCSWRSPHSTQNKLNYIQIKIVKFNP